MLVPLLLAMVTRATANDSSCESGDLTPAYARRLPLFSEYYENVTITLAGREQIIAEGKISWRERNMRDSRFAVLPGLVTRTEVQSILSIAKSAPQFDLTPSSVDGSPTYEWYIRGRPGTVTEKARRPSQAAMLRVMAPIEARITAHVRQRYPEVCASGAGRYCTPCYSLVRRYNSNERREVPPHRDGQALVTVVTSLSDYGDEYLGGIYVSATGAGRQALPLARGDALVHQSDLLHGVQVDDALADEPPLRSERWTWILWYKDSESCEGQHGHEWSKACAEAGDAICQYQYGWRLQLHPLLSDTAKEEERFAWYSRAADNGSGQAMFKVGRNLLGMRRYPEAEALFRRAAAAGDADASYQLAHLMLLGVVKPSTKGASFKEFFELLRQAASAGSSNFSGAPYAMYNLGIVHLFGFGRLPKDARLAVEWFKASRLPEGSMMVSAYYDGIGKKADAEKWRLRAKAGGIGTQERRSFNGRAMFGLHNKWPGVKEGRGPPKW